MANLNICQIHNVFYSELKDQQPLPPQAYDRGMVQVANNQVHQINIHLKRLPIAWDNKDEAEVGANYNNVANSTYMLSRLEAEPATAWG